MICPRCGDKMVNVCHQGNVYKWQCTCNNETYEQQTIESQLFVNAIDRQVKQLQGFLLDFRSEISKELAEQLTDITSNLQLLVEGGKSWSGLKKNRK